MSEPTATTDSTSADATSADATSTPRWMLGFLWGAGATVVMSIPMLIGTATGVAPMPEPIPAALVTLIFGSGLAAPLKMGLAVVSHLAYGGVWGALLAVWTSEVTIGKGLALGTGLWLLMQVAVLPILGWGAFGLAETPAIAVATLVLHLIYGGTLGWGLD